MTMWGRVARLRGGGARVESRNEDAGMPGGVRGVLHRAEHHLADSWHAAREAGGCALRAVVARSALCDLRAAGAAGVLCESSAE